METDPTTWRVAEIGQGARPYAVRLGERGPFAVGKPGRYRPRGAIITFRYHSTAQRRADDLNLADAEARR